MVRSRDKSVRCVDANISNILRNSSSLEWMKRGTNARGSTSFCNAFPRKLVRNLADDRITGGVEPRVRTRWKEISVFVDGNSVQEDLASTEIYG